MSVIRIAAGDHAIEAMALGIEWGEHLSEAVLEAAASVYGQTPTLVEFLPGRKELPGLKINMAVGGVHAIQANPARIVDFSRVKPDGSLEWLVSLRPDFFSCTCGAYSGWKAAKARTLELLLPFADVAWKKNAKMQALGLQYFDVFRWDVGVSDGLAQVLKPNRWIPSAVLEHRSAWHVHQGWFSEGPNRARILNNLNVDFTAEGSDYVLRINGQHRLQAVQFDGTSPYVLDIAEISALADVLHEANKAALHNLLTPEMISRIGMKPLSLK